MAIVLTIKVAPNAGKQEFKLDKNNILKCFLKSAPEQGKANAELIKLLSKALNLTLLDITLIQGATNRTKKIKIETTKTLPEILALLGISLQTSIL